MADIHLAPVLRYLRRLSEPHTVEGLSDAVLLDRLAAHGDSAAFETLLRRHGPLVWRLCRRVLHREQDAEDAFQATFLALAHRAKSIRKPASLASFLHGTAYRIARRVREDERRRSSGQGCPPTPASDPGQEAAWRELGRIVEEEVHALPEGLRIALLLCYWEGLTNDEAARRLGWPCGTLKTRLAKARKVLHDRLVRRGVTLPAGAIALVLAPSGSEASVPPTLAAAAARAVGTAAPPHLAALAKEGLKFVTLTRAKIGLVLLILGTVASGMGVLAHRAPVAAEKGERDAKMRPAKERPVPRTDLHGDPLPERALTRLGTVRFRMGGLVYACAWSPDGKILAASSDGNTIRLFDATTGKPIHRLRGQNLFPVLSLAWSPDGKTLASGCADNTIHIWEPATRKMPRQFATPQPVWSLAFTRDSKGLVAGVGDQVAGAKDSLVLLYDPATGKERRRFAGHKQAVRCVALSPDGRTIASAGGAVRLWELETGKMIRRLTGQKESIRSLALDFSPDGKLLATGSRNDLTVCLREASTGKVVRRLPEDRKELRMLDSGCIRSLAFSPDGKTLAISGADHSLRLRDVATGKKRWEISGVGFIRFSGWHDGGIQCVAFAPDGGRLAFVQDNRLALLDVQSGKELRSFQGHGGAVQQMFFNPDSKHLITVSDDPNRPILEWDSASGQLIRQVPVKDLQARLVAFSPDRKVVVSAEVTALRFRETTTGKEIRQIPLPFKEINRTPGGVAFSPDGKLLAVAEPEGEAVWLMDATADKQACRVENMKGFFSPIFSPDGRQLVAANRMAIHLAEVPSGRQIQRIVIPKGHSISGLAISPDGRTLATPRFITFKQTIALWEAATGKERLTLSASDPGEFKAIAFSPDGRLLAAGNYAGIVLLWDTVAGKQVGRLEGHPSEVTSLAFSPDGRRLASGSLDTTALIWDVTSLATKKRRSDPLPRKELEALWSTLAAASAAKAYQAILTLETLPEQAVPLLAECLRRRSPPDAERIAGLVKQLDSEDFAVRQRAAAELRKLGWMAELALLKALEDKPSLEVRKRVKELLDEIFKMEPPPELLQSLRAVEVLERIGAPEAKAVLRELADGAPATRLTREAKASLDRLARP